MGEEAGEHEVSAGMVVVACDSVLIILNRFGEWVLPKGKVEPEETPPEAALREVLEETGVRAEILCPLGTTDYTYVRDVTGELVDKTVHWYLGTPTQRDDGFPPHTEPQREEGISCAKFVPWQSAVNILKYEDSKDLVILARKRVLGLNPDKAEGK
ncbi:MAG TPA: NUDIX hydrolase [Bacillota bacterium]|nr:NUDIX hydrolase [Bacillota bacterium]